MKKKSIALLMAVVMLFGVTMGATIAWLTAETEVVTNTFTYGDIELKLDEEVVDKYGVDANTATANRTDSNIYKLIPGHTYTKDPTVYVKNGSEKCWVFAKVTVTENVENVIEALPIDAVHWLPLEGVDDVYYYYEPVDVSGVTTEGFTALEPVFETFTVKTDAVVDRVTTNDSIIIDAYAVQWDGFATAKAAFTTAPTWN